MPDISSRRVMTSPTSIDSNGVDIDSRPTLVVTVVLFSLVSTVLFMAEGNDYPILHTILDTSVFLTRAVLTLLLWDIGSRSGKSFPRLLALTFAAVSCAELLHTLVAVEWSGSFAWVRTYAEILRPSSWPPTTYLLSIGVGVALLLQRQKKEYTWLFGLCMFLGIPLFLELFSHFPKYTPPIVFGITRPFLILVPLLWLVNSYGCWKLRHEDRIARILYMAAALFFIGNVFMLYSRAPHDTMAMVAHLGKVMGDLFFLVSLMQMGSLDMVQRIKAETELKHANEGLEQRVRERTAALEATNQALKGEIASREQAERKLQIQLDRLNLLHQITRAIGERQDLQSIFQVVVRSLEDNLPIDFGCVCLYEKGGDTIKVTSVGVKSQPLALELAMPEKALIPIDQNGLSRAVQGKLVYEPDISAVNFPFPKRLVQGGLRSLVVAPLLVESSVFGVLIATRKEANAFSSTDCEFLRQLSEHVALASHQSNLYHSLQRAYDDLRQTQQAVMQQERLRALGQMASGIAHDINNAISPAALYTESLLEKEPNLSDRARNYLETIGHAIDDVAATVARMREFYRQREPQLSLTPVSLNRVVQQVADLTRARWNDMPQQRGIVIKMEVKTDPDLPSIMGMESEIREALTNLIFNGVDALPEGGTLTLRTRMTETAPSSKDAPAVKSVSVEVTDTGVGMNEDTKRRCLEPFFTTKGDRGTGLGLAMVYGIVQRHSADIDIESAVGKGTTVRLSFPVPTGVIKGTAQEESSRPVPSRMRILIVDDDPILLKSLQDTLEMDGHTVVAANGGQAGIDAFREAKNTNGPFDVVITDLGMPHVDGRKVAKTVKDISKKTPIILLTGWGQRLIAEGDVPPHVERVLSKPPKLREVREALSYCFAPPKA